MYFRICPSRSGDDRKIIWQVRGRTDSYFEDYRANFRLIVMEALKMFPHLAKFATEPTHNQWERNLHNYLGKVAPSLNHAPTHSHCCTHPLYLCTTQQ